MSIAAAIESDSHDGMSAVEIARELGRHTRLHQAG